MADDLGVITLCSAALVQLGADPITSFDEASPAARACRMLWPILRDEVLASADWNCAVKRVALVTAGAPVFGFAHSFQLPSDCLRVIATNDEEDFPLDREDYRIEGRTLATDLSSVMIRYVFRNTDSQSYSPMLLSALTARMAAALAVSITGKSDRMEAFYKVYQSILADARGTDKLEGPAEIIAADNLITVRY